MSLLHSDAFLAHLSQSKSEAKRQVNSMIDAIYAKVLLDLELWLNKDKDRKNLELNHNDATDEQMQSMSTNTQQMHENVNCPPSLHPSHLQSHSNHFQIKTEDDEFEVDSRLIQFDSNEKSINLDSISNPKQSTQSQPMIIKEEIDPMPAGHVHSCSYAPVSNKQSNHNLTDQHSNNNEEYENFQINLPYTQMLPQPQQFANNKFDDEECDCDECIDGLIKVNQEDEDEKDQDDEKSNKPVKRPRMETTHPNNVIHIMEEDQHQEIFYLSQYLLTPYVPQQTHSIISHNKIANEEGNENIDNNKVANGLFDEDKRQNKKEKMESEAIDTQETIGDYSPDISDGSNLNQEEEREEMPTTNSIHLNLAKPNRHLQCSDCHKSFVCKSKLQTHLRVHTGERPFQCDQCDKRFSERGNLNQHQQIHQNIKNFQCPECDKQFTLKHSLDSHLLIHSGDRPFACRHCEKSFTDLCNRNRHEQAIHLHVKPYRCKQCGHTATHQSHIIRHIRQVHFGLPQTLKQQRALNILDERDPRELVEKLTT